jgi:hypothetical protein
MKLIVKILYPIFGLFLMLTACSEESNKSNITDNEVEEGSFVTHDVEAAKKIFFILPSPIETAFLIQKAGANYDGSILNPVQNSSKYETTISKALNLGIYATDLSVASVFDQTQEGMLFVISCKKMSDALGISEAFDAESVEKIEANLNDKDSLLHLISETYLQTDIYLKENDLASLSSVIITGGWIEGLYVAIQLEKQANSKLLRRRIAEQKFSLIHLIEILSTYKNEDKVEGIYEQMVDIYSIFEKIKLIKTEPKQEKNVIGASNELDLTDDVLLELDKKVTEVRNNYINS